MGSNLHYIDYSLTSNEKKFEKWDQKANSTGTVSVPGFLSQGFHKTVEGVFHFFIF